ncbi:hypothetical protein [Palleronia sp.]|uniref:hypothetical protein n=1 Tax=Palleronia sp. TaxID=1940284 RepID=UPI0035C81D55
MRYALILSLVALPAFGQDAGTPDAEAEPPVGGVGRLACAAIIGPENAPYLGQAGDWALGYMAGRLDAGDELGEGSTLSPDDSLDVVAGIAVRCHENPDQPVIEAVRGFAQRVFGTEAQAGPVAPDAPPPPPDMPDSAASAEPPRESIAPEPRPDTTSSDAASSETATSDAAPSAEAAEADASSTSSGEASGNTTSSDGNDDPAELDTSVDSNDGAPDPGD